MLYYQFQVKVSNIIIISSFDWNFPLELKSINYEFCNFQF